MNEQQQLQPLDPRVITLEKGIKIGGVAVVAVAASVAAFAAAGSIIVVGAVAVGALAAINFVPVAARYFALQKQQGLTKLAEVFSEETIRDDEVQEGDRIKTLESQYKISRSELEGAQGELREQLTGANEDEAEMLKSQIAALQDVIDNAENTLRQRKADYEELKRVNKLYIAFHRSAKAMENSQGAERDPAELQRLETSRTAIKTRMRQAMAGKTIETMNSQIQGRRNPEISKVAHIGNSKPVK